MPYLITQIFALLIVSLAAGIFFGWLQWSRGKAKITQKKWKDAQAELKRLRRTLAEEPEYEEIARLRGQLTTVEANNETLESELESARRALTEQAQIAEERAALDLRGPRTKAPLATVPKSDGAVVVETPPETKPASASTASPRENDAVVERLRNELAAMREVDRDIERRDKEIAELKQKLSVVRSVLNTDI